MGETFFFACETRHLLYYYDILPLQKSATEAYLRNWAVSSGPFGTVGPNVFWWARIGHCGPWAHSQVLPQSGQPPSFTGFGAHVRRGEPIPVLFKPFFPLRLPAEVRPGRSPSPASHLPSSFSHLFFPPPSPARKLFSKMLKKLISRKPKKAQSTLVTLDKLREVTALPWYVTMCKNFSVFGSPSHELGLNRSGRNHIFLMHLYLHSFLCWTFSGGKERVRDILDFLIVFLVFGTEGVYSIVILAF